MACLHRIIELELQDHPAACLKQKQEGFFVQRAVKLHIGADA